MKRKGRRWALLQMFVWGLAGCAVEGNEPIRVLGAVGLSGAPGQCTFEQLEQLRGSLDISLPGPYVIGFRMESALQPITEVVGEDTLSGGNRNDFYGEKISFRYTANPALGFPLKPETLPVYLVIRAAQTNTDVAFGSFLSPTVTERLIEDVAPGSALELEVEFEITGHLGGGAPAKTNKASYPIYVFNSGFSGCPPGERLVTGERPCGRFGGQDGAPIVCEPVTP